MRYCTENSTRGTRCSVSRTLGLPGQSFKMVKIYLGKGQATVDVQPTESYLGMQWH